MTAQVIFSVKKVLDQAALVEYRKIAHQTIADANGRVVAGFGDMKTLEGDSVVAMIVVEFRTREEAETWFHSAEYQKASELRRKGSDCAVSLVSW